MIDSDVIFRLHPNPRQTTYIQVISLLFCTTNVIYSAANHISDLCALKHYRMSAD